MRRPDGVRGAEAEAGHDVGLRPVPERDGHDLRPARGRARPYCADRGRALARRRVRHRRRGRARRAGRRPRDRRRPGARADRHRERARGRAGPRDRLPRRRLRAARRPRGPELRRRLVDLRRDVRARPRGDRAAARTGHEERRPADPRQLGTGGRPREDVRDDEAVPAPASRRRRGAVRLGPARARAGAARRRLRARVRSRRLDVQPGKRGGVLAGLLDELRPDEGARRLARRPPRGVSPDVGRLLRGELRRRQRRHRAHAGVPARPGDASLTETASLRDEATQLLGDLIRLDTVNPPGNETQAAELLRAYLAESGVESELYARSPERANLVARIPGSGGGSSLLLLSHTDTVVADRSDWQHDPWSGEVHDGELWGRGALDMKGQVAAEAVALASLAREGFEPAGDLVFAACADEEVGAGFGASWLCEEHGDAVRCDYLVNEGSGDRVQLGAEAFYLCSVSEKMSAPFRLRVQGRSGHASMPGIADNALVKAAPFIQALGAYTPEQKLIPEVEALLETVTGERPSSPDDALERARAVAPLLAERVEPLLSMTLSPTMVSASLKRNVIPAICDVIVDSRLLPGTTPEEQQALVRE